MTGYQKTIAKILKEHNLNNDPRHIEAFMRSQYNTLDWISLDEFNRAALEIANEINALQPEELKEVEEITKSYGF